MGRGHKEASALCKEEETPRLPISLDKRRGARAARQWRQ